MAESKHSPNMNSVIPASTAQVQFVRATTRPSTATWTPTSPATVTMSASDDPSEF